MLYLLEAVDVGIADEGDGLSVAVGTCCAAYAVHIVLGIVGHIIVDDGADIVDVDTSGNDVGGNQHIHLSGLEAVHHLVALLLGEVAVHLVAVDVHLLQTAGNLFDALFLAGEDDDTL